MSFQNVIYMKYTNLEWIEYCENNTKGFQLYIIVNFFVAELMSQ